MANNIYSRQQWKLIQKWISAEDAQRISYFSQKKNWTLNEGKYQLSDYWNYYSHLSSVERAMLRRAKREWKPMRMYKIEDGKVRLR